MRMIGPLLLILLLLVAISKNYTHSERVDMISSNITLDNDIWKKPYDYNQYGHQYFPDKNGCGGKVFVTKNYQHGFLTSPDWPGPMPPNAMCVWKVFGLTNFFLVVNAIPKNTIDLSNQTSGFLTVKNVATERTESFILGGDHLESASFLNNSRQEIEIRMVANSYYDNENKGFKLTWWTVPRADFSKIYPSDLWDKTYYFDDGSLTEGEKNTVGYVFTTHIHSDTITLKVFPEEGKTMLNSSRYDVSFSKISFDKGIKSTHQETCIPQLGECWMTFSVYSTALIGIEITSPKNVGLRYMIHASPIKECPVHRAGDIESFGHIYTTLFDNSEGSFTYLPNAQCQDYIQISPDVQEVFMQVRMQTDIQPSPSCVADYLKIGSQRVCGINGPNTYMSSPVDNSLIDRTGTYYINIVSVDASAFASEPVSENHTAHLALNADLSLCYVSHHDVFSPYWVLDLEDVFTVHGVRILPESPSNVTVAVYVKNREDELWPAPSYQTCWHGPLILNKKITRCNTPVSGQYLAIVKYTANITLCTVQVFVNIASPVKAWRNAVYGVAPKIQTTAEINNKLRLRLVDGDRFTCIEETFEPGDYLKFTLSDDDLTVHAVKLYVGDVRRYIQFESHGINLEQQGNSIMSEKKTLCVDYKGHPDTERALLLSCNKPLRANAILISIKSRMVTLCEVIVYADSKDQTITYAALHKPVTRPLKSRGVMMTAPALVDGRLRSCDLTRHAFFLDLLTLHIVEGVNLYIGDQKGTLAVTVWVSPDSVEVNNITNPNRQCQEQQLSGHHRRLKISLKCTMPKMGRYIMLNVTRFTAVDLHLCELQVIAAPYGKVKHLQNVALFKHAWQGPKLSTPLFKSSQQLFYYGHSARYAVDGDTSIDTMFTCTELLANETTAAWWLVDLANIYEIHVIRPFLRSAHVNTSFTINIFISRATPPQRCYSGAPADDIHCNPQAPGRFVHIITSHNMSLCEVQVLAIPLVSYERFGELPEFINGSLTHRFSFVTNGYIQNAGFLASYRITDLREFTSLVDCGEVLRSLQEHLMSPNYPESYALPGDHYICHWMIPTPDDGFVVVYIDYMDLTESMSQDNCLFDALIFSNTAGQQITKCGFMTNRSLSIQSFRNDYLHVTFIVRTGGTQLNRTVPGKRGFELHFSTYSTCTNRLIPLTEGSEQLYSPMYPSPHPPFAWCSWTLEISTMGLLRFIISALDLHKVGQDCGDDEVLRIHSTRHGLHNYCGDKPPQPELDIPVQTGDTVMIVFKSTENIHRKGFYLNYTFHPFMSMHREVLDYNMTVIENLGYPKSYDPENVSLTWTFTSRNASGKIHVNFTDLDVWPHIKPNPGFAYFSVDNYLTMTSDIILNTTTYNDSTKEEDRYSIFPFYPNSVFKLTFKPDYNEGKHDVRFRFSITVLQDEYAVGLPKVFVGEETQLRVENTSQGFRFSQINLNENMVVYDRRFVYIMETGVYLVSIRVFPMFEAAWENLELHVNFEPTSIVAYSALGTIGNVAAALELNVGDMLSVVNTRGLGVDKLSMFTVVYISSVEEGYAFTGLLTSPQRSGAYLDFANVITSIGLGSGKQYVFEAPLTGIYWVTIRPDQENPELSSRINFYKGKTQTYLEIDAEGHGSKPASAALHIKQGDIFWVTSLSGTSGLRTLLSVVLLVYNKQPHTGDHEHIAATVTTGQMMQYTEPNQNLVFDIVVTDHGSMLLSSEIITIPRNGLYLVSIRNTLPKEVSVCLMQFLHLKVNGEIRYIGATLDNKDAGHVTVLRLNANDSLTVSPRQYNWVANGTLFSVAFVHP